MIDDCIWYSPSTADRSNPNDSMVCPMEKPKLCWMDTTANSKRQFKCGNVCDSQTETCHISEKANEQNTGNKKNGLWEKPMTTTFNSSCKNKWRQF